MNQRKMILFAIAGVAIVSLVAWLRPSETKRVRKVFATVSSELHKDGQEGLATAMAKARALANLVAPEAQFEIDDKPMRNMADGRELTQQIMLLRGQAEKIEVDFEDLTIAFDDERTASVTADVFVRGFSSELGLGGRDARALEAVLEKDKDDGKWRFKRVSVFAVVEK